MKTPMEYMLPDVGSTDTETFYETSEAEFMAMHDLSTEGDAIECPTCEGSGEICPGVKPATYWQPREPLPMTECPICEGAGEVDADEPDNWTGWPVSEEEAAEILAGRYMDPDVR